MSAEREILVHVDLDGASHPVGLLRTRTRHGRSSATFEYDDKWLENPLRFSLEPALHAGKGTFVPSEGRAMFASIGDSAPDTWGRRLMQRVERRAAKKEGRAVRTLTEADYLLGVADVARLGALRLKEPGQAEFQAPLGQLAVPPFIELPKLLSVTERVLRNEETDEDLLLLFAPGSSLGGARPKASVRDRDGALAIAKFPKKEEDDYSVEVWEEVALRLADKAKIRTAPHRLERPLGKPVLLSRRFDRDGEVRVPFLSALAMLDFADGQRGSYPEVVDALRRTGSKAESDVPELYRRMVFNVLISNVDDHLRNHGFIWKGEHGWRLSPAYDINPIPADLKERILCTNITLDDGTCDLELLRETSEFFDLDVAQADAIISEVAVAVTSWREVAAGYGVRPSEIDRMASAFEHDDLKQALVNKTSSPPPQAARP